MSLHTPFNPDPAAHQALLDDLMDSSLPLRDLADRYETSLSALCFWMATPEVAAELSILHASAYNRARLTACTHLDSALQAMALIVRRFLEEQASPDPDLTPDQRRRAEEVGRRAAAILLRFIKNKPANLSPSPGTPTLRGGSSLSPSLADHTSPHSQDTSSPAQTPESSPPAATQCAPANNTATPEEGAPTRTSTTTLAHAALQALAEMRPDLSAAPPNPSPPPPPTPNPQSEIPNPKSQPIDDFLQAHLQQLQNATNASEHPTSAIPHPTSPPLPTSDFPLPTSTSPP